MYNIEFYEDKNGKSEVFEYIQDLKKNSCKENKQKLKKIDMYLDLLSKYGLSLAEPYIKKLDTDIWELRPARDRVLFVAWHNNGYILLHAFEKRTAKTPEREKQKARNEYRDLKERGMAEYEQCNR